MSKKYFVLLPLILLCFGVNAQDKKAVSGSASGKKDTIVNQKPGTYFTGAIFSEEKYKAMPLIERPLGFGANLPKSFSLDAYTPSVGNQGNYGSCVGWSTTYYGATMAYNIEAEKIGLPMVSYFAFDPMYTYENIKSDNGCENGTSIEDALAFLDGSGAKRYFPDNTGCNVAYNWYQESQSILDITDAYRLFGYDDTKTLTLTSICQALVDKQPVIVGLQVTEAIFNVGSDGLFVADYSDDVLGGHAMCVVGYDDNKYGGAFLIINSWGDDWGNKGYMWMKYSDFYYYVKYGYTFESKLKGVNSYSNCLYGNCNNGYGLQKIVGKNGSYGYFEGFTQAGEPTQGLYFNSFQIKGGKGGMKWMSKMNKKYSAELYYWTNEYQNGALNPIGFVLNSWRY